MHQIKLEKAKRTHPVALPSVSYDRTFVDGGPGGRGDGGDGGDGAASSPGARFIFLCKTGWLRVREEGARPGEPTGAGLMGGPVRGVVRDRAAPVRAPAAGKANRKKVRRASFAPTADDGDEMDLAEGDVLEDMQDLGGGWSRAQREDGGVGTFPSAYVQVEEGEETVGAGGASHSRWART